MIAAAREIFADQIGERSKLVDPGARAALLQRRIPALANEGFHFRKLPPRVRDREGRKTPDADPPSRLIALPSNARLESFDAARLEANGKAAAEGQPRSAVWRTNVRKMGLQTFVCLRQVSRDFRHP